MPAFRTGSVFLGLLLAVYCCGESQGDEPFGLSRREPWTESKVTGSPEPPPPYRTQRVFPTISFHNPVAFTQAPGSDRWYVAEQNGLIYSFANAPQRTKKDVFLDVRTLLKKEPADSPAKELEAIYGLVFHPQFPQNGYCYVCYVVRGPGGIPQLPAGTRVSRFTVSGDDPPQAIPESEQVIITWLQGGHNGGCLKFGPDGNLYISTGDGSSAFPPDGLKSGQDVSNLLSAILRIDVDHPTADRTYSIPVDNPFVGLAGARGEIWAFGLRNPWKMSFDRQTGDLWVGDVGWELWELVYRVTRGGNYGWSIVEGPQSVHVDRPVGPTPILAPTLSIPHTDGVSVTGGFVYRGKRFPELVGQYVFGDWETRRIWGARFDGQELQDRKDLVEPLVRVVDFAEDEQGELYLLDYDDGTLHALQHNTEEDANQKFPTRLSETGLYSNTGAHRPAPGVVRFEVNVEQWRDFAQSERWVAIPGEATVNLLPQARPVAGSMFATSMVFPKDSVLFKTFSMQMIQGDPSSERRIETQLLHFDGKFWRGYSYAWNEDQSDAELVGPSGATQNLTVQDPAAPGGRREHAWRFSSRVECARCHNQWAEYTLGFNLRQLNRSVAYGKVEDNQLRSLQHAGLIELSREWQPQNKRALQPDATRSDWAASFPKLTDPYHGDADLESRARSYLHVNCAHCHRNGGGGTAYIELQRELTLAATKTVGVKPTQGTFEIPNAEIIAPGDPFRSVLFYRVSKVGGGRMPHIGSDLPDPAGVGLLHDWIRQIPPRPEETVLLSRLIDLNDVVPVTAEASDPQAAERAAVRAKERRTVIADLLNTTSRALKLAHALERGELPPATRDAVILAGAERPEPQIRDLFERFLPVEKRIRRLGAAFTPGDILDLPGDVGRGRELFLNTPGIQCKNCHAVQNTGGKVGPELTQIGKKYPMRTQLLEQILEPSKVIDPKFQAYVVTTTDGRVFTGILMERTTQALVLRDAKDQEIRLLPGDVERTQPQGISLMPDQQLRDLTPQQAADLLAFLESLR